jgi:hypothetical protein
MIRIHFESLLLCQSAKLAKGRIPTFLFYMTSLSPFIIMTAIIMMTFGGVASTLVKDA